MHENGGFDDPPHQKCRIRSKELERQTDRTVAGAEPSTPNEVVQIKLVDRIKRKQNERRMNSNNDSLFSFVIQWLSLAILHHPYGLTFHPLLLHMMMAIVAHSSLVV
jgi:hypothetical protein